MSESDSWQFNKSVVECNKYMLEHGIATDVTFVVSNKLSHGGSSATNSPGEDAEPEVQRFEAHRYMLISRSPVFYAMLCGEMAEKGEIAVEDVDPDAFQQMLKYIYSDEIEMTPESVLAVLYVSKKYLLPGLASQCSSYLQEQVDESNACTILDQSLIFDEPQLIEKCSKIIQYKTSAALDTKSFLEITQNTLAKLLDFDIFTVPEVDLFRTCIKWAQHQSGKQELLENTGQSHRQVLGKSLYKIHFTDMDIHEFASVVSKSGVLTCTEECEIFRYLASPDSNPIPQEFKTGNRYSHGPWEIKHCVEHLEDITTERFQCRQAKFTLSLQCSTDIILQGIRIGKYYSNYVSGFGTVTNRLCDVKINNTPVRFDLKEEGPSAQYVQFNAECLLLNGDLHEISLCYSTNNNHTGDIRIFQRAAVDMSNHFVSVVLTSEVNNHLPVCGIKYAFPNQ